MGGFSSGVDICGARGVSTAEAESRRPPKYDKRRRASSLLLSSGTRRSLCPLDSAHSLPIESPRRERLIREEGEGRPYFGAFDIHDASLPLQFSHLVSCMSDTRRVQGALLKRRSAGRGGCGGCGHVGLEVSQLQKQSRVVRLIW